VLDLVYRFLGADPDRIGTRDVMELCDEYQYDRRAVLELWPSAVLGWREAIRDLRDKAENGD
tara:strand:- start:1024 stop:1209 length:186 start_codon:yes stop_codon:yes gene_type:complete